MGIVPLAADRDAFGEPESDPGRAAAIVAALIPLIILLPLQRFYVQGVTAAATKD